MSTPDQHLENQILDLRKLASQRGFEVVREDHDQPLGFGIPSNETEAAIVKRILQMSASGVSLKKIAKTLHAKAVESRGRERVVVPVGARLPCERFKPRAEGTNGERHTHHDRLQARTNARTHI